jgi:hypothetical protein
MLRMMSGPRAGAEGSWQKDTTMPACERRLANFDILCRVSDKKHHLETNPDQTKLGDEK